MDKDYTDGSEQALGGAFGAAEYYSHKEVTTAHLALMLIGDKKITEYLYRHDVNVLELINDLNLQLKHNRELLIKDNVDAEIGVSAELRRILEQCQANKGEQPITPFDMFRCIYEYADPKSQVIDLLEYHGASSDLFDGEEEQEIKLPNLAKVSLEQAEKQQYNKEVNSTALGELCTNLNDQAADGKIGEIIGRDDEISACFTSLARKTKPNPILVGEAGVGKTAIAEGMAKKIVDGEVPERFKDAIIFSLNMGKLVAGTKYRGDFEKRLKAIMEEFPSFKEKTGKEPILFIDEIHTVIGAGESSDGNLDAANILKPALQSGQIRCLGATTEAEYKQIFEKDKAIARRFTRIDVKEPSVDDTIKILKGIKKTFESHHGVKYPDEIIEHIVTQASHHMIDRNNPDKSIDIMDICGADLALSDDDDKTLSIDRADKILSAIARIPVKMNASDETDSLLRLEDRLKNSVFDQNEACSELADYYIMARAEPGKTEKPIANFLFTGPTGVGKTEVSTQLAKTLGIQLKRFDMSEFMEKHTVSRLIGAPPGYVGYEQGGFLTNFVKNNPHCVILMDEIEKAHPDLFNILLQVMDYGKLTDHEGTVVDFSNVILIMTSNIGVKEAAKKSIGFVDGDKEEQSANNRNDAIKALFAPEFINRLDKIIEFKALKAGTMIKIVDKLIAEMNTQYNEGGISISFNKAAKNYLAQKGYVPEMGARPLKRLIVDEIRKPLSKELLKLQKDEQGAHINVLFNEDKQKLEFEIKKATLKPEPAPALQ